MAIVIYVLTLKDGAHIHWFQALVLEGFEEVLIEIINSKIVGIICNSKFKKINLKSKYYRRFSIFIPNFEDEWLHSCPTWENVLSFIEH